MEEARHFFLGVFAAGGLSSLIGLVYNLVGSFKKR